MSLVLADTIPQPVSASRISAGPKTNLPKLAVLMQSSIIGAEEESPKRYRGHQDHARICRGNVRCLNPGLVMKSEPLDANFERSYSSRNSSCCQTTDSRNCLTRPKK